MLSHLPSGQTNRCVFRTAHDVRLWPIRIVDATLHARGLPRDYAPVDDASAALSLTLENSANQPFSALENFDDLTFFLRDLSDRDQGAFRLYEQIFGNTCEVAIRSVPDPDSATGAARPGSFHWLGRKALRRVGFSDDEAVLPITRRGFQGYRLLREYFFFERRFLFFKVAGLAEAAAHLDSTRVEIVLYLRRAEIDQEVEVNPSRFALFATPASNVFKRSAQVTPQEKTSDFVVVPNRKDPLDYEVFDIEAVEAEGANRRNRRVFFPFYSVKSPGAAASSSTNPRRAYFTSFRTPRELTEPERLSDAVPAYRGSQVRLSLVDVEGGAYDPATKRLTVRTLCTNRDLVLRTPWSQPDLPSFPTVQDAGPVSVRGHCLVPPSPPRPSMASGQTAWRLVNHLSLNYLSLLPDDEGTPEALQDLLRLYAGHSSISDPDPRREDRLNQIRGIRGLRTQPVHQRFREGFVRGLGIEVSLDEKNFLGGSAFLLGAVLDEFFSKYVSINSYTQTSVRSTSRGELVTWPPRIGRRNLI